MHERYEHTRAFILIMVKVESRSGLFHRKTSIAQEEGVLSFGLHGVLRMASGIRVCLRDIRIHEHSS